LNKKQKSNSSSLSSKLADLAAEARALQALQNYATEYWRKKLKAETEWEERKIEC